MTTLRAWLASIWAFFTTLFHKKTVATPPAPRRKAGLGVFNFVPTNIAVLNDLDIKRTRTTLYWQSWVDSRVLDTTGNTVAAEQVLGLQLTLAACDGGGIEPVIVVHSPPQDPTHDLAWGVANMPALMAGIVKQFPGRIWQIMNEMDGQAAFNGGAADWFGASNAALSQGQRGALYGQLLAPVYDAIKAADPTATVITGGIGLEPTGFFNGLLTTAAGKYDAVAVHCYANPGVASVMQSKSSAMRAILGSIPLWCTEWGSNIAPDAVQAGEIGAALDDNDAHGRYDRHYVYQLDDTTGYNVLNADGTFRPSLELLANRTAP